MKKMKRSFDKFVKRLNEIGLHAEIEKRALKLNVTLRDLYEGSGNMPSIVAARRSVYTWLISKGKGSNEVARLFDRAPSGVCKMTQEKTEQ